jgi:hypothetical protein
MNRSALYFPRVPIGLLSALASIMGPAVASAQPVGSEFQVNTYTTSSQHAAVVAKDASGGFVAVWESDQNGDPDIFGQRFDDQGSPVGYEFQVNTYTTGVQRSPALAVAPSGVFVVVWEGSKPRDPDGGLFGQRYDSSGNALGREFRVNTTRSNLQSGAAIAFYGNEEFVVVWQSPDGNGLGILGQRYDAGGIRSGAEFRINMKTAGNQITPSATSDGLGNFIVVWSCSNCRYDEGGQKKIRGRRYDSSGQPLGHEFAIDDSPPYVRTRSDEPDVAADANGNFVVVWGGREGWYYNGIYGRRYNSAGLPLGGAFTVDITDYGPPCDPCKGAPSVTSDAGGNFIVVWEDRLREESGAGVFARPFDADGKAGSVFRVNSHTTGIQKPAPSGAISSDPLGNFVVVWQSDGQDGSGYGVFGQQLVAPALSAQPTADADAEAASTGHAVRPRQVHR